MKRVTIRLASAVQNYWIDKLLSCSLLLLKSYGRSIFLAGWACEMRQEMRFSHTEWGSWAIIGISEIIFGQEIQFLFVAELISTCTSFPTHPSTFFLLVCLESYFALLSWQKRKHTQTFVGMSIALFEYAMYLNCEVANNVLLHSFVADKWNSVYEKAFEQK